MNDARQHRPKARSGVLQPKRLFPRSYVPTLVAVAAVCGLFLLFVWVLIQSWEQHERSWYPWVLLAVGVGLAGPLIFFLLESRRAHHALAGSENQYRTLVEFLNDGLGMADEKNLVTYVNPRFCEMIGCSPDELLGRPPDRFYDDESRARFAVQIAARRRGADGRYELNLQRKDGQRVPVLVSDRALCDEDGAFRGSLALIADITEQKRTEEALRQAKEELQTAFDAHPDISLRIGADGTVLNCRSRRTAELYLPLEQFLGRKFPDYLPSPVRDQFRQAMDKMAQTRSVVTIEYKLPVGGKEQILEGRLCPLPDGEILLLVRNITRRKQTELALAESEKRYRVLVESMNEGIGITNEHEAIVYANPRFCEMLGYSKEELEGQPCVHFFDEESQQRFLVSRVDRQRGIPGSYELLLRKKTGEPLATFISEQPVIDETGTYRGSVGIIADISKLKRTEEELRVATEELRAIYAAYPDMSFRLAPDGTVLDYRAGKATREQMYLTPAEFLGRRGCELLPPPGGERLREAIAKAREAGSVATIEYSLPRPWGVDIREARVSPMDNGEVLVVVRDITDRKRAEDQLNALSLQLLRAQDEERKRIAHELHDEFGQSLAVVSMSAQRFCAKIPAHQPGLRKAADQLRGDVERAIRTMRTMQRGLYPTVLDHLGLDAAIDVLVSEYQERTGIACNLDVEGAPFNVDEERARAVYRIVQEALTNVARHAEAAEIDIIVRRNGSGLHIEVGDDGRGIELGKVMAPTSYGLTGMRKRAELCGGDIEIRARPGGGTLIVVQVPLEPNE
jgi:PAS domain S-box-containing protein